MSTCKKCGNPIDWRKERDRWQCYDAGTENIHWDLCSRAVWQQVKDTGERFEENSYSGYANSVHGTKLDRLNAKPIRGALYAPTGDCIGCVPPWEVCGFPCADAISA